jgi:predicted small metal-binding protein
MLYSPTALWLALVWGISGKGVETIMTDKPEVKTSKAIDDARVAAQKVSDAAKAHGTMLSFACKDIGMDCKFQTTAPTEAELMKKIAEHAKSAHKIETISAELMGKIKKAIKK